MSRKDYIALAQILNDTHPSKFDKLQGPEHLWDMLRQGIEGWLAQTPGFDRDKFKRACRIGLEKISG